MRSMKINTGGRPPILSRKDVELIVLLVSKNNQSNKLWTLDEMCGKFGCCRKTFWRSLKKYYEQDPEKLHLIKQQIKL